MVASVPIAFALKRASAWLRSTIGGFVGCVAGVAAAVAFGWFVFNHLVGPGAFTLVPFLASVLILTLSIPRDFRQARQITQQRADLQQPMNQLLASEIGNPWSTVFGDVCGLILAATWFLLA